MLEETVVTTENKEVCVFRSTITSVTVSTVYFIVYSATKATDGNQTNVVEDASVVTAAAAAIILGCAIALETNCTQYTKKSLVL